jgi:hypothetical protein
MAEFNTDELNLEDQSQDQQEGPKPKFNPKKSFTPIEAKPAFDPSKVFEPVSEKKNLVEPSQEPSSVSESQLPVPEYKSAIGKFPMLDAKAAEGPLFEPPKKGPDALFKMAKERVIADNTRLPKIDERLGGVLNKGGINTAIENATERSLKSKGVVTTKNSSVYNTEKQKISDNINNGYASVVVHFGKDENGNPTQELGITRNVGFVESLNKNFYQALVANDEANEFVNKMTTDEKIKYLDDKQKVKEGLGKGEYLTETNTQMGDLGKFVGENALFPAKAIGGAVIGAGLVAAAPETMGASLLGLPAVVSFAFTAKDAINQGSFSEISERYSKLIDQGVDKKTAMETAEKGLVSGGILGGLENAFLTGGGLKPFSNTAKSTLEKVVKETLTSSVNLGSISGAKTLTSKGIQAAQGYNVTPKEVAESTAQAIAHGMTIGGALHILSSAAVSAFSIPKILKNTLVDGLSQESPQNVNAVLDANQKLGNISPEVKDKIMSDIDKHREAREKVADGLSDESKASIAGLIQLRDKITEEAKTKDPTQAPAYQQRIDAINEQIAKITETNDPLRFEVDEATGRPYQPEGGLAVGDIIKTKTGELGKIEEIDGDNVTISDPKIPESKKTITRAEIQPEQAEAKVDTEAKKADIERRRQEELNNPKNGLTIKSAIVDTEKYLEGLQSTPEKANRNKNKIEQLKKFLEFLKGSSTIEEAHDNFKDWAESNRPKVENEDYTESDKHNKFVSGINEFFNSIFGAKNNINAKYDAELAALEKAVPKISEGIENLMSEDQAQSVTGTMDKMERAEAINENELKKTEDILYGVLDKNPDASNIIEPLIKRIQDYEFKTKTEVIETTEKRPIEGAYATRTRVEIKPALEQSTGKSAEVELTDGTKSAGKLEVESGNYVIKTPDGESVIIGETAITNRDLKAPEGESPVALDENGNVKSVTFETRDGKKVTITDPEKALDLGIQLHIQMIGQIPDAAFEKAYQEVVVTKEIETPIAPRIKEFAIGYAPFREGNITDISKSGEAFKNKKYQLWRKMGNYFADLLGIKVEAENNSIGIYGATSANAEASAYLKISGTEKNVDLFASLMGTMAPQGQHSVMKLQYDELGNAAEIKITFENQQDAIDFVNNRRNYGVEDVSLLPESNSVIVLDYGGFQFEKFSEENASKIKNVDERNFNSEKAFSINEDTYSGIIRRQIQELDKRGIRNDLSDVLELAEKRARRLRGEYSKKSEQAKVEAEKATKAYIDKNRERLGLPEDTETVVETVDPEFAKQTAADYDKLPEDDSANPEVQSAYNDAVKEINEQYDYLTKELGIKVEFVEEDPYPDSASMFEDIVNNKKMRVYKGGEPHPFLGESSRDANGVTANEKLRAVHDYFGHFVNRNEFGKIGEERAWVDHSKMFSPNAQRALTTETRGQNSWVNFSGANKEALDLFNRGHELIKEGRVKEGNKLIAEGKSKFQFAVQKVALLPESRTDWRKYEVKKGAPKLTEKLYTAIGETKTPAETFTSENINQINPEKYTGVQKIVVAGLKNIIKSVSNLVEKTTKKKLSVTLHNSQSSYEKAVLDADGTVQDARTKGFFLSSDGSIHLNMNRVTEDTLAHEATHPILDYLAEQSPKKIDDLYAQLGKIKEASGVIERAKRLYAGETDVQQKKEAITDFIARVASGDIKLTKSNFQAIRDYVVNMLNSIGIKWEKPIESINDLRDLAQTISKKFYEGEEISVKGIDVARKNKLQASIIGESGAARMENSEKVIENLALAKELESRGVSDEEIRKLTMWERGADGNWNLEIPPGKPKPFDYESLPVDEAGMKYTTLKEIWDAKDLFDSYKETKEQVEDVDGMIRTKEFPNSMADTKVVFRQDLHKGEAGYNAAQDRISLSIPDGKEQGDSFVSAIVHELQHAIQNREFWEPGLSVDTGIDYALMKLNTLYGKLREAKINWKYAMDTHKDDPKYIDFMEKEVDNAYDRWMNFAKKIDELTSYEVYKRGAGETQARNVSERFGLTEEQRAEKMLRMTEDVGREEQIILDDYLRPAQKRSVPLEKKIPAAGAKEKTTASDLLNEYEKGQVISTETFAPMAKISDNIVRKVFSDFAKNIKEIKISGKRENEGAAFYDTKNKQIDINKNSNHWKEVESENILNSLAHEYTHHLISENADAKSIQKDLQGIKDDMIKNKPKDIDKSIEKVYDFIISEKNSPEEVLTYAVSNPEIRPYLAKYAEKLNEISKKVIGSEVIETKDVERVGDIKGQRPQFQAEDLISGKEEIPQFKELKDVAKWLGKWSKKNKIIKGSIEKASDEKFVSAIVDHTIEEIKAWEIINDGYKGFYDEDIPKTLNPELVKWAEATHGKKLTNDEISLYHILSSFASPSATPVFDSNIGLQIFDKYLRTGEISPYSEKQATVWATDKKGKRFDTGVPKFDEKGKPIMSQIARAYAVESLDKFKKIVDHFGGDIKKAVDWVESQHSYEELSEMMGTPLKGPKALTPHENLSKENGGFGVFAISGPKLGSYILNRVGNYSTVTKDLWYARTMARLFGEPLIGKDKDVLKEPWATTVEGNRRRRLADQAWKIVADKLNTTPAVIQQRVWDFEKRLWQKLGADQGKPGYASEGFLKGVEAVSNKSPLAEFKEEAIQAEPASSTKKQIKQFARAEELDPEKEAKVVRFIEDQRKSGESDKDIKDVLVDYGLTEEQADKLMAGESIVTGIKIAKTEEERVQRGLQPIEVEMKRGFGEALDEAKSSISSGKINPKTLAAEISVKPRPLTAEEGAALMVDRMDIMKELARQNDQFDKALEEGNQIKADIIQSQIGALREGLELNDKAARLSGYEAGLGLGIRRMLINQDYSFETQLVRFKTANGGKEIPQEFKNKLKALTKRLNEATKKLEEYEKAKSLKAEQGEISKVKPTEEGAKAVKEKTAKIKDKIIDIYRKSISAIKGKPKEGGAQFAKEEELSPEKIEALTAITPAVKEMVMAYAESGITDLKSIINTIHSDLVKEIPDLSVSDLENVVVGKYKAKKIAGAKLTPEEIKVRADVEKVKDQIDKLRDEIEIKNRTKSQKTRDYLHGWHRFAILSGIPSLGKISTAALARGVTSRAENVIAGALSKIPGISYISKMAPREGGLNAKAEAKAFTTWFDKMTRDDFKQVMETGLGELDYLYGNKKEYAERVPAWMEFFGKLHASLKLLPKRAEFFRSLEMRTENALKKGEDINDPIIQEQLAVSAYNDACRAIFMQDNPVTDAYRSAVNHLEKTSPNTASALKFMFPIIKVPTNYVFEESSYMIGGLKALYALRNGVKNMTPEQADYFMRALKKQSIGLAFMFLGYSNPNVFGGYYTGKRKKEDLEAGDIELFGMKVPHWMTHTPLLEMLQVGATIRRADEAKIKKGEQPAPTTGISDVFKGQLGQVPFYSGAERAIQGFESKNGDAFNKWIFGTAESMTTPQLIQNIADWSDTREGEKIKRTPEGFLEQLMTGVPGLRQRVPEKVEGYLKDQIKTFDFLTERGVTIPDFGKRETYKIKTDEKHPDGIMSREEYEEFVKLVKAKTMDKFKSIMSSTYRIVEKREVKTVKGAELPSADLQNIIEGIHDKAIQDAKKELGLIPERKERSIKKIK